MAGPFAELDDDEVDPTAPPRMTPRQAVKKQTEEEDIRWLMDQPQFHRFLLTVIEKARINARTFWTQPTALAHSEGRRDLGLEVLDGIRSVCPQTDLRLATEQAHLQSKG